MTPARLALLIGVIPVVVGLLYWALQQLSGERAVIDAGGALLLLCLGISMAFGFSVILRGARDL